MAALFIGGGGGWGVGGLLRPFFLSHMGHTDKDDGNGLLVSKKRVFFTLWLDCKNPDILIPVDIFR